MRKISYIIAMMVGVVTVGVNAHAISLSPKHRTDVQQAELYLNSIGTLTADFTQTTKSSPEVVFGKMWLKRPGKIRWHYKDPIPVDIAIRGTDIAYYDRELDQLSHTTLEDTLAAFLTRSRINFFSSDIEITDFLNKEKSIYVTVAQKGNIDQGQLTLIFQLMPKVVLQGLHVHDAVGNATFITFHNQKINQRLDDEMFVLVKPVN